MKRILIIEDEKNIRETLCDLLVLNGYSTSEASDGEEGVRKVLSENPDMIICDINMPVKNGYEVLADLKKNGRLSTTSFIFLTANSSMEQLRKGMELGADDYLIKPFTTQSLMRTLKSVESKKARLSVIQEELNIEKMRVRNIDQINSHELRRKMVLLQSLLPVVKRGEIPLHEGIALLEACGEEIDQAIHLLASLIDERNGSVGTKTANLDQVRTIWLIDDDQVQNLINRMVLKKVNRDWVISEFTDAQVALQKLESEAPDLIFLDISMPEMNGFDFLTQVQQKKNTTFKIAMLSSSISYLEIKKAISYTQVINYITKPLKEEKLAGFIR